MRAITLTQPWCGLMAAGIKRVENRRRPIITEALIGERIAFHASREYEPMTLVRIYEIAPELQEPALREVIALEKGDPRVPGAEWVALSFVTSAVVATATLVDILRVPRGMVPGSSEVRALFADRLPVDQLRWFFQENGYVFSDPQVLAEPVPCRGMLGCWTLPTDIAERVESQIARAA